jgi:hypothetical protein
VLTSHDLIRVILMERILRESPDESVDQAWSSTSPWSGRSRSRFAEACRQVGRAGKYAYFYPRSNVHCNLLPTSCPCSACIRYIVDRCSSACLFTLVLRPHSRAYTFARVPRHLPYVLHNVKMHGLSLFFAAALAVIASATPTVKGPTPAKRGNYGDCLSAAQATVVANNFRATIAEPFSAAFVRATFTVDFQDYSDSVNELINGGCPTGNATLGAATFPSRKAFITGQGGQAPIDFTILDIWYNCDTVIMRWMTTAPGSGPTALPASSQEEVTGIIVLEVVCNQRNDGSAAANPWLIERTYSEFNSGAWLYDLGIFKPTCSA